MHVWITGASAWIGRLSAIFRSKPPRTLHDLLRMAACLDGLVSAQLSASLGQEATYRRYGSYNCVLERNRHVREARNILEKLDAVIGDARKKFSEIELAMSLPVRRGEKPDKLDQQNLMAVQQHLDGLEAAAQRLRRVLEEQETKQLVPSLV